MALPFLAGRPLGEICHIIQLAIACKQILGYADGAVVPHHRSEAVLRLRCAAEQRPIAGAAGPGGGGAGAAGCAGLPEASLEEAQACVRSILGLVPGAEPCEVPLPNIKRLFRSRFGLMLSETCLGYARLIDLIQDAPFSGFCALRPQAKGSGYGIAPLPR
uniref:HTH OST-type domain-containing protein n=1 Tax=Zooxanthella nutricula TaxID=1333877 RepID=A0A7S2MFH4_9DINO